MFLIFKYFKQGVLISSLFWGGGRKIVLGDQHVLTVSKKTSSRRGQADISLQKYCSSQKLTLLRCKPFRDRKQTDGLPAEQYLRGGESSNTRYRIMWSFRTTSFWKTVSGKLLSISGTDCNCSLIVRALRTGASCSCNDLRQNSTNPWEVMVGQDFSTYLSTGIIFHRDSHRLESKLVFIASLIETNERIWMSKSSGKLLIISENVTSSVPSFTADISAPGKKLWN